MSDNNNNPPPPSPSSSRFKEKGWEVEIIVDSDTRPYSKNKTNSILENRKRSKTLTNDSLPGVKWNGPPKNSKLPPLSKPTSENTVSPKQQEEAPKNAGPAEDHDPLSSDKSTKHLKKESKNSLLNIVFGNSNKAPNRKNANKPATLSATSSSLGSIALTNPDSNSKQFLKTISESVIISSGGNEEDGFMKLQQQSSNASETSTINTFSSTPTPTPEVEKKPPFMMTNSTTSPSGSPQSSSGKKKPGLSIALDAPVSEEPANSNELPQIHENHNKHVPTNPNSIEYSFVSFLKEVFDSLNKLATSSPSSRSKGSQAIASKLAEYVEKTAAANSPTAAAENQAFSFPIPPTPFNNNSNTSSPKSSGGGGTGILKPFSPKGASELISGIFKPKNPKLVLAKKIAAIQEKLHAALMEIENQLNYFRIDGTYKNLDQFRFGDQDDSYGFVKTDLRGIISDYLKNTEPRNMYVEGLIARLGYHMKDFEADKAKIREMYNIHGNSGQWFLLYMGFLMSNKRKILTALKELSKIQNEEIEKASPMKNDD